MCFLCVPVTIGTIQIVFQNECKWFFLVCRTTEQTQEEMEEVTRYLDGYERYMIGSWVDLRGELDLPDADVDALGVLRERLPSALRSYALGRLSIDTTAPPRYVPVSLPPDVRAAVWDDSKESAPGALVPRECGPVTEYRAGMPLVMARVAQRGARVQLTVLGWHVVADGRTIEGVYRIVAHVLDARVPLPADAPVPAFGQREAFAGNVSTADMVKPDEMWAALPRGKPAVPPLPARPAPVNVLDYVRYRLAPVRAYARAHGVGVQALLMAAAVAAHRAYNEMAPDAPVVVDTAVDTRHSPFAAPAHAARELYSGSAVMHTVVTAPSSSSSSTSSSVDGGEHREETDALIRHCHAVVRAAGDALGAARADVPGEHGRRGDGARVRGLGVPVARLRAAGHRVERRRVQVVRAPAPRGAQGARHGRVRRGRVRVRRRRRARAVRVAPEHDGRASPRPHRAPPRRRPRASLRFCTCLSGCFLKWW